MFSSILGGDIRVHQLGLVAQWITRLTTDQKIPGSNPGKIVFCNRAQMLIYITMYTKQLCNYFVKNMK